MENAPTKVFTRTFYENTEWSSCVCVQCNQSASNPCILQEGAICG